MMDKASLIALVYYFWTVAKARAQKDPSSLFGKEEKLDKLVIKNQIAYHFKKVVREVKEELFVSRRIDVSLLFAGIQVLQKTETEVRNLCNGLPSEGPVARIIVPEATVANAPVSETKFIKVDQHGAPIPKEPFILVPSPIYASFKEAKARCTALGMQLPELYQANDMKLFTDFLNKNSITHAFAGMEPDLSDSIIRHISTQYPIWKTVYTDLYDCSKGTKVDLGWSLDDGHSKFLYTNKGTLCVSRDTEDNPIQSEMYASHRFREHRKILSQITARIVCSPKWDGLTNTDPLVDNMNRGTIIVKDRHSRSAFSKRIKKDTSQSVLSSMKNVKTLCLGVADHAKESYTDIQSKMADLLALVDITIHDKIMNDNRQKRSREKRVIPLFLMKFIFVSGVKLLWQLFGFVQKVKMNKRLKNIESMLQVSNNRSIQNSEAIARMTKLIEGNSVAINQLNIRVDGLERRLELVEIQLGTLKEGINSLTYKFEIVTALITIDNLVVRTRRSMDTGYDILKDIIHNSIQKQTSPLVLPLDQIELVQGEVSKGSTALLDPDFAKMQSIVVSDPSDPSMLLIVVNLAALDRRDLELVQLVPIPYYEGGEAFEVKLDYRYLVLDQSAHTFSILSEQEENDCLFNRCYIGSAEQSLLEKSCGIPQFYDQHKNGCVSESVVTNGVFLKPMLPDGVLFALKGEIRSEVFCLGKPVGIPRKLRGTGILQLPNGCLLQAIDEDGKVFKIKGLPQHTIMNAGDYDLMPSGPLSAIQAEINTNNTRKIATVNAFVESRVSSVIKQVEQVDDKMFEHHRHVWILTGTISLSIVIIVIAILLLYRFSTRARRKIRDIRGNFSELKRKVLETELDNPVNENLENEYGGAVAPPPQRRRDVWLRHLREKRDRNRFLHLHRHRNKMEPEIPEDDDKESTYIDMCECKEEDEVARYVSRPLSKVNSFKPFKGLNVSPSIYPREYPRIPTPLIQDAQDYELDRLREETELSVNLSEALSPRTMRRKLNESQELSGNK